MKEKLLELGFVRRIVERRGAVVREEARCVFCGLCARTCPMGAVAFDREARTLTVDGRRCVRCGKCVSSCPRGALHIQKKKPARKTEGNS